MALFVITQKLLLTIMQGLLLFVSMSQVSYDHIKYLFVNSNIMSHVVCGLP